MKTTKDTILLTALDLFAERGFDAVSTGMIAERIGITKGALYRHFDGKQQIFDSIIQRMFQLDAERANEDHVPAGTSADDPDGYRGRSLTDLCAFVLHQFTFWTEHPFASAFRRMITIEQYRSPEMNRLYQDVIAMGPVTYTQDLLEQMLRDGTMNEAARAIGPRQLAVMLFAPLKLTIELADGGADPDMLRTTLSMVTKDFESRWIQHETLGSTP